MTESSPICRICLTAENRSFHNVSLFARLMQDLGGISVHDSDGFPQWLCADCVLELKKCTRFKEKMVRAHSVLYQYLSRCAPFSIDGTDQELLKYASPQLSATLTLSFDSGKGRVGFHKVLQHKSAERPKFEYRATSGPDVLTTSVEIEACKVEPDSSDYEDNIPLEEYKHAIDKFTSEDLSDLLQDGGGDVKTEEIEEVFVQDGRRNRTKRKHNQASTSNGKLPKTNENLPKITEKPHKPTKEQDVDPTKIKVILLDPEEQIAEMRIESEMEGICKLKFKCKLCYKGFNYKEKLDNHMAKHSPSRGEHMCKLCHMYLPTTYSYNVHMYTHTRRYECLKCGRRMVDRQSIVDHYRSQHEGLATYYTCNYCGKVSSNDKTHRGHLRNHHGGARPKCDICGKTFVNKDSLTEHILIHQGIKNYECLKCGKKFRTKTQLKHHQLKHTDVKEFYCVECDTRFKSAHSLKQHLLKSAKHRDAQSLQFQCRTCGKRYETESLVSRHERIQHLGERPYGCGTCPARLATRAGRDRHERRHTDTAPRDKLHCCHTCGRTFTRASVLAAHARTHSGARPHACGRCARTFTQRASLFTHVKLVHLHLKRTDKVKPEVIYGIPKFSDTDNVNPQFMNKPNLTADLENKTLTNDPKLLDNITKIPIEYKIEQNQNDMVQNTELVQTGTRIPQMATSLEPTKIPIQSKIILHNQKLTPIEMKIDNKDIVGDGKGTRVDGKLSQANKERFAPCGQPKEEMFEEEWREDAGHQVYYYTHH